MGRECFAPVVIVSVTKVPGTVTVIHLLALNVHAASRGDADVVDTRNVVDNGLPNPRTFVIIERPPTFSFIEGTERGGEVGTLVLSDVSAREIVTRADVTTGAAGERGLAASHDVTVAVVETSAALEALAGTRLALHEREVGVLVAEVVADGDQFHWIHLSVTVGG